jgi:16S rRNA (cytosine967-C5)-methyltransferase
MTPAARQAAALDILNRWRAGHPAEAALTHWARASRFAGSGDREAVRDLVFRAIRQARSLAALGGGEDGRALLLGMARADGVVPGWDGTGHAPAPLTEAETARLAAPPPALPRPQALDCPDWLLPLFDAALGDDTDAILNALRHRAPVFVRANRLRATPASARAALAEEGILAAPHPLAETALEVGEGARKLRNSNAFAEGLIEMQDAASQAVALAFAAAVPRGAKVLDYCAGGGGKALALAAEGLAVSAHDSDPGRMSDLPARAKRAGARVNVLAGAPKGPWPAILADAPCSGSGSWRRAPEAKWALDAAALAALVALQDRVLDAAAAHVAPGGVLAYATCSLLDDENGARVAAFRARLPGWVEERRLRLTPLDGGDGFFLSVLRRTPGG